LLLCGGVCAPHNVLAANRVLQQAVLRLLSMLDIGNDLLSGLNGARH
jgi:hypothetical protein